MECATLAQGLISRGKDIVFTSGIKNIEGETNIVGVFHVGDLVDAVWGLVQVCSDSGSYARVRISS